MSYFGEVQMTKKTELLELIEDLRDRELMDLVKESRDAVAAGVKEISVEDVFKKIQ